MEKRVDIQRKNFLSIHPRLLKLSGDIWDTYVISPETIQHMDVARQQGFKMHLHIDTETELLNLDGIRLVEIDESEVGGDPIEN